MGKSGKNADAYSTEGTHTIMGLMLGGNGIIRDDSGALLLIKREDFRVWAFPGGGGDPGESPADTTIREVREETGVEVALDELVGVYTYPEADSLVVVYTGHPVGGAIRTSIESVDVRYVSPDALPGRMLPMHRERLLDALEGRRGVFRCQPKPAWMRVLAPVMLAARKLRNRLRGRPETPPPRRDVVARGTVTLDGSGARFEFEVIARPGQPIWDTLRLRAERETGQQIAVERVIDVAQEGDQVVVEFALSAKPYAMPAHMLERRKT